MFASDGRVKMKTRWGQHAREGIQTEMRTQRKAREGKGKERQANAKQMQMQKRTRRNKETDAKTQKRKTQNATIKTLASYLVLAQRGVPKVGALPVARKMLENEDEEAQAQTVDRTTRQQRKKRGMKKSSRGGGEKLLDATMMAITTPKN